MKTARNGWMLGALALVAMSGTALAQDAKDGELLKGPEIVENSGPDGGATMSGDAKQERTGELRFQSYMRALRVMNKASEERPELALSEEHEASIREIAKAHREEMRAFMEAHREELEALRPDRGERRGGPDGRRGEPGGEPGGDPMMMDDEPRGEPRGERPSPDVMQRNREALAELMSQAPSDEDAKKALWDILSESQREFVTLDVMRQREEREKRIDGAMKRPGKEEMKQGDRPERRERLLRKKRGERGGERGERGGGDD